MKNKISSRQSEPFWDDPLSYSRLNTWMQCAIKGHAVYDLGFVSGAEASHNIKGKIVHDTAERLHLTANIWALDYAQSQALGRVLLNKAWILKLGGKEEFEWLKNYSKYVSNLYEQAKVMQQRKTGKPCLAPWKTTLWQSEFKPKLAPKERILKDIEARLNFIPYMPLPTIFKDSYRHLYNYVSIVKAFDEPDDLYTEYIEDPLTIFEGTSEDGTPYLLPFRGAIDQLWIYFEPKTERIHLYDIKTSRRGFEVKDIWEHDQLWLYARHIKEVFGGLPKRLGIIDLQNGKLVDIAPNRFGLEKFEKRFEQQIKKYVEIKLKKDYAPAGETFKKLCSFCDVGIHGNCRYFKENTQ